MYTSAFLNSTNQSNSLPDLTQGYPHSPTPLSTLETVILKLLIFM